MRQLSNHLSACPVLNEQRVFAADPGAPRYVRHFDEHTCLMTYKWRHAAVDDALPGMSFGGSKPHLDRVVIACRDDAAQDISQLRFIVNQPLERFALRAAFTDAEYVLCCTVQTDDQQILIEQNDSRTQAVEDIS